jgi:hypothetical protein
MSQLSIRTMLEGHSPITISSHDWEWDAWGCYFVC